MKKFIAFLLVLVILTVVFCPAYLAEVIAEPILPKITVDVTQLVIAIMAVVFNVMLAWIIKAVIPPAKRWLDVHTTAEQQNRVWTMVKWLVEAAEQTIIGYGKGSEKLAWVLGELRARGIQADQVMIEAAVKEMKDNAAVQIDKVIKDPDIFDDDCEACKISFDDGK